MNPKHPRKPTVCTPAAGELSLSPAHSMAAPYAQRRTPMRPDVSHFDKLPDSAMVTVKALAELLGQGYSTIWRKCHEEPGFPQPIRMSPGCTRFNVGAIRVYLATKVSGTGALGARQRTNATVGA